MKTVIALILLATLVLFGSFAALIMGERPSCIALLCVGLVLVVASQLVEHERATRYRY